MQIIPDNFFQNIVCKAVFMKERKCVMGLLDIFARKREPVRDNSYEEVNENRNPYNGKAMPQDLEITIPVGASGFNNLQYSFYDDLKKNILDNMEKYGIHPKTISQAKLMIPGENGHKMQSQAAIRVKCYATVNKAILAIENALNDPNLTEEERNSTGSMYIDGEQELAYIERQPDGYFKGERTRDILTMPDGKPEPVVWQSMYIGTRDLELADNMVKMGSDVMQTLRDKNNASHGNPTFDVLRHIKEAASTIVIEPVGENVIGNKTGLMQLRIACPSHKSKIMQNELKVLSQYMGELVKENSRIFHGNHGPLYEEYQYEMYLRREDKEIGREPINEGHISIKQEPGVRAEIEGNELVYYKKSYDIPYASVDLLNPEDHSQDIYLFDEGKQETRDTSIILAFDKKPLSKKDIEWHINDERAQRTDRSMDYAVDNLENEIEVNGYDPMIPAGFEQDVNRTADERV